MSTREPPVPSAAIDLSSAAYREYISSPLYSPVLKEMERIRALFHPSEGDAEDLVTYAKEIVKLRASNERARVTR